MYFVSIFMFTPYVFCNKQTFTKIRKTYTNRSKRDGKILNYIILPSITFEGHIFFHRQPREADQKPGLTKTEIRWLMSQWFQPQYWSNLGEKVEHRFWSDLVFGQPRSNVGENI